MHCLTVEVNLEDPLLDVFKANTDEICDVLDKSYRKSIIRHGLSVIEAVGIGVASSSIFVNVESALAICAIVK